MTIKNNVLERPFSEKMSGINFFITCLLASFAIAVFGHLRIFTPFSPIPIVFQMQFVYLLGYILGPKKAALATVLYIIQAAIGLPVLPSALFFSIAKGYYIGFLLAGITIGALTRNNRSYSKAFLVSLIGNLLVYIGGFSVFCLYVGAKKAFLLGVVPFIIPDLFKNLLVVQFLKVVKWTKR